MVKLADTQDLGSCAEKRAGSSPVIRTTAPLSKAATKNAEKPSVFVDKAVNQIVTAAESAMGEEPSCKATG